MSYLVVKILLLLALAALFGGLLGYWLIRRRFIEVTDEYERFIRAPADQGAAAEQAWRTIEERLASIGPALAAIPRLDLAPIQSKLALLAPLAERLEQLERAVGAIRMTDLSPLEQCLAEVAQTQKDIERLLAVALGPLVERIDRLQQQLDFLAHLERQPAPAPPPATPPHDGNGRNLLQGASFGPPDDLKCIRGVGPVLDRHLHRLGVFYFWQIAEWTEDDVAFVDGQLDVFKGRIARDAWVTQAARLAHEPDTAKSPSTGAATESRYSAFVFAP